MKFKQVTSYYSSEYNIFQVQNNKFLYIKPNFAVLCTYNDSGIIIDRKFVNYNLNLLSEEELFLLSTTIDFPIDLNEISILQQNYKIDKK